MGITERRKKEKNFRCQLAMNAAIALYNEEGYHAITIEKIAGRSELSRASLYLYFKNKDDILIRAIVCHTEYFIRLLQDLYDNRELLKHNLLEELWSCFIKFHEKEHETFNVYSYFLQSEMIMHFPQDAKKIIEGSGSRVVNLQHKIVEYGIQEGVFIQCHAMTLAEVIWTSFLGIASLERSKEILSHKDYFRETSDLALKILAKGILNSIKSNQISGVN
jgi:AcrR family transcriptional regulator